MRRKMERKQENHLNEIKLDFCKQVDEKYRRGQEEHGEFLKEKDEIFLLTNALEEVLDCYVYLRTRLQQIEKKGEKK